MRLAILSSLILGAFSKDSGRLIVNSPQSLVDLYSATNGTIDERQALFGIPASGHQAKLTGTVVYIPADDLEGCVSINPRELVYPPGDVFILVVERGNCTFVTKVKHAEDAGARACIIVDNQDEEGIPYMADDGKGSTISIPSMLIHKKDGAKISDAMNQGQNVMLTMAWNIPHPDNIVEWQFWTTSDDDVAAQFKRDFDQVAKVLGSSAVLTPHYFIGNGFYAGCFQPDASKPLPCGDQCINSGRYCSQTTKTDSKLGVTGGVVIKENLRQICIFNELNKTGATLNWWNYLENFAKQCPDFSDACAESTYMGKDVGLTKEAITACMGDFSARGGEHKLLENEIKLRYSMGVWQEPTILINDVTYRGSMSCGSLVDGKRRIGVTTCGVLAEMCLGYLNQSKIAACTSAPDCELGLTKDVCGTCGGKGVIDQCGECRQPSDPKFDKGCQGCDGKPNSGLEFDECQICGGAGVDKCQQCLPLGDPKRVDDANALCPSDSPAGIKTAAANAPGANVVPLGMVIPIVLVVVVLVGAIAFFFIRHRNKLLKNDIDELLRQYLPMEGPAGQQKSHNADTETNIHV